ncbi:MAG: M48 family metalloprotease [Hyphomicrobium sp.]|nr:M48 family metalloprotease [Hyphomicrobium sp.]
MLKTKRTALPSPGLVSHNVAHSLTILIGLGFAAGLSAYLIAGLAGIVTVAIVLVALTLAAPRVPAETLMRLYSARLVPLDDSQLSSLVDVLAWRAGLVQRPDLYLIPSMTLHAFAAGTPARPAIAISEGLVRRLSLRELAGVLAHETSHIRNGDLWIMGLADLATRVLHGLAYLAIALAAYNAVAYLRGFEQIAWTAIAILYLTPAAINLLQLALSRAREYEADRLAAALTGDPVGLASALRRVETYTGHFWEDLTPPVPARRVPQPSLLRTHPPADQRVARLLDPTHLPAADPLVITERPMVSLVGMGPASLRPRYRWLGLWY